ncbi:hypothetical protein M758_1G106400 [Ceratodon purpureus]|nr:hypothetical protein M758_1G106400 [Ceratodon purpureus]
MGRIGRLPSAVVSNLRSNVVVTSFEQAVEELVCNSLDAGATQVRVLFDGGGASVKVEDDGHGISRDDLELVGLRHATSKLRTLDELEAGVKTLGFRGEALSSLSDISILEVTSKVQGCPHTFCKIMKGSSTVSLGLSSQQRAKGTTVAMRDIFYNQPVRRRLFHSSSRKLLQSVKERIVRLALAHSDVSFILTDSLRMEEELHIRQHTSLYGTLQDVFGCELCQGLKEVGFAKGRLRLSGFLSSTQNYTSSKAMQYFYINHRFVYKTPFHKLLNRWGKSNAHIGGVESKGIEKVDTSLRRRAYPAFVLNLSCQLSDYDITFEATKTYVEFKDWTSVLMFLEKVLCTSWGDEEGKRQAPQPSGKRKFWCTSDRANESSLEMKLKSKRARTQTVNDDIIVDPLPADSVSLQQLGSNSLREDGIVDIDECPGGEMAGSFHSRDYLRIGSSCSSSWGQLAKPVLVREKDGWLDGPGISPSLFMDMDSAYSLPDCASPDVLCLGSPSIQAISMPSSPIISEGSWDSGFNPCHGVDDFASEVSFAEDQNTGYGELQLALHCLGSGSSDTFQEVPRPLRAREPWISPPTMGRDSDSMRSFLGGEMIGWTLPAVSPSMDVLLSHPPTRSWSELELDGSQGALNEEDVAAESCSDVEEAQFHFDLHRWSDRLEKPFYGLGEVRDYRPEVSQVLLPSGQSSLYCATNTLAEVSVEQEGDGQKSIGMEVDNAVQGEHTSLQDERPCTSLVETPVHDMVPSKFRSTNKGSVYPDEDLSHVASLYKVWSNPCMRANVNDILDVSAGVLESCTKSLQPDMVTKESLEHARVLQQVDTKFIAIVTQNVLLLVDQHAADERVQLEEFRAQVLGAGKKQCSTLLDVKHDLTLGLGEQQTLHAYRKQIEDWGWHFQPASDSQSFSRNVERDSVTCNLQLTAVPCILGVNLTAIDLEEYLQQLGATRGASVPPPAVVRLLNYKSCRGAIMFGDSLLPAECRQLVSHLKRTSLCFQCAHGRPTMVPLVNLHILRQHLETKISKDGILSNNTSRCQVQTEVGPSWHKLMQRPLSLMRARERLHQLEHT